MVNCHCLVRLAVHLQIRNIRVTPSISAHLKKMKLTYAHPHPHVALLLFNIIEEKTHKNENLVNIFTNKLSANKWEPMFGN